MSKHPSDNVKSRLLRRGLAGILSLVLILSLMPSAILAARAASWADPYVNTLVDWGVMRGDINGNMNPDRNITRAEFVAMMNRAYGYTKLGGNPFTDVGVRDWFYEDIDIAYNIGYFKGTTSDPAYPTASPNASLTREQAAVMLARNMMLQETVGETLGFSDSRQLNDWSRGLIGAAAANGIIGGYEDGSFKPSKNITRGEVAAMLVRAIGTPIQTPGDHALGNIYGNVTVSTSGVKLRDGVIVGNLYLTGGIDLGEVLLENITVLGEIIVSGGGESNSSESSIIMRNVVADNMVVDSISNQFVTLRAEGNTDIPTVVVRTNAYVDDSSLPGFGLNLIILDGENGALFQLAGNIKEAINKTPGSDLQVVQGLAGKITVDEYAKGSSVLVDGDAQVGDLNLDTATTVTGTGDIGNLHVGAAGSTVEQLPDNVEIRPGITTDIAGESMNSSQAAESSADPKLLAGYPAVKNIAPTSATLVFKTNKTGTVYWAVSAVADGSVTEANLLEPPVYGGNIVASGNLKATAANKEFTAAVSKLTSGGSYYVTAMLVDGRGEHSPIKVTSFTTPDDSVPAFAAGYPVMTKITCAEAQVTVMTTKSCLLYYALLPKGAAAPKAAEFKAGAIPGNLGYGSMSVTKNVTYPFPVNSTPLDEKTDYVLYLWLTDHDGAKSSAVRALPFTTPDETPPNVTDIRQTKSQASSVEVAYTIDEPADLVWAIVTEADHMSKIFLQWADENFDPGDEDKSTLTFTDEAALLAAKVKMLNGIGLVNGRYGSRGSSPLPINGLTDPNTSSYVLYYMANDKATATGNLSLQIKALRVYTLDTTPPTAKLAFTNSNQVDVETEPDADATVRIVFSENVKGGTVKGQNVFLNLYDVVRKAEADRDQHIGAADFEKYENAVTAAKNALAVALSKYITLYGGTPNTGKEVDVVKDINNPASTEEPWINWHNAVVEMKGDGTVEVILRGMGLADKDHPAAINLKSGGDYYFKLLNGAGSSSLSDCITDISTSNNKLQSAGPIKNECNLVFKTAFARIIVTETENWGIDIEKDDSTKKNDTKRFISFTAEPTTVEKLDKNTFWDMLIWCNTTINFTLYYREMDGSDNSWTPLGSAGITVNPPDTYVYTSLKQNIEKPALNYTSLKDLEPREYLIYIDSLGYLNEPDSSKWNYPDLEVRISFVASGNRSALSAAKLGGGDQDYLDSVLAGGIVSQIEEPSPCYIQKEILLTGPPSIQSISLSSCSDISATINVTLDREGSVYYLLLPVEAMKDGKGAGIYNDNTVLTETLAESIESYEMYYQPEVKTKADSKKDASLLPKDFPSLQSLDDTKSYPYGVKTDDNGKKSLTGVEVAFPGQGYVTDGTLADTYPQGRMPATGNATARSRIEIKITEHLEPNTIYYLFLVTRSSTATYSPDPVCYRFTTSEPVRPKINLANLGSGNVNIWVDRPTRLTYIVVRNGEEGSNLRDEKFSSHANSTWYKAGGAGWTPAAPPTGTDSGSTKYTYRGSDGQEYSFSYEQNGGNATNMTVLDAMATPCYNGVTFDSRNNYAGSVFDVFATNEAKEFYQGVIGMSTISGLEPVAQKENATFLPIEPENTGTVEHLDLPKVDGNYTILCVGTSPDGSGYAFRALYPIIIRITSVPKVQNVNLSLTDKSDASNLKGTVTIYFSQQLYFINDRVTNTAYVVDDCKHHDKNPNPSGDSGYWALGDVISSAGVTLGSGSKDTITSFGTAHTGSDAPLALTMKVEGVSTGTQIFFNFKEGLTNSSRQNADQALSITLEIVGTQGATPANNTYSLKVVQITEAWRGEAIPKPQ